jgi:hypothetical protein
LEDPEAFLDDVGGFGQLVTLGFDCIDESQASRRNSQQN